ncbi:MAG: glycosyltransferase, partial [Chloroflexota bacterium]|nr:glycosyltransferase [Chloroflexota bacterium]
GSGLRAHNTYLRLSKKYDINFDVVCSSVEFIDSKQYLLDGVFTTRIVSTVLRKIARRLGKGPFRRIINAAVFHVEARTITKIIARKQFDIIHVFGYSPATVAAINWSRRNGIPLMLEIVNNIHTPYQYLPGVRKFRSYDLARGSVIIAISKHIAELCQSTGLSNNVWTRPNPVDTYRFRPVSDDQRSSTISHLFGFNKTDKVIVYVAKFMKQKNHQFLIDVMKYLPDKYKLVLAGPTVTIGESDPGIKATEIPQLKFQIEKGGLAKRVKVIPEFVDTAKFLSGADVFCFPAENEAMGTPLIEALSNGTPVIANADEPSFAEWIDNGKNGYLVKLDPESWADSIVSAAKFTTAQRLKISSDINTKISVEMIDESYKALLDILVNSSVEEMIDVERVLR